jgi:hypothetical protein
MKFHLTIFLLLILPSASVCAQLETKFGPVLYETNEQIIDYERSLGPKDNPDSHRTNPSLETIISRHENLFEEVCAKLDIYLNDIKTTVRIVASLDQLRAEYKRYVPNSDKAVTAFYSHQDKTIWYSQERLSYGIILHETAHAVMDHYFIRPIPAGVDELVSEMLEQTDCGSCY